MTTSINEEKNTSREIDNSEVNDFRMNDGTFDDENSQRTATGPSNENATFVDTTESIDVILKDAFAPICDEAPSSNLIEKLQNLLNRRL